MLEYVEFAIYNVNIFVYKLKKDGIFMVLYTHNPTLRAAMPKSLKALLVVIITLFILMF